MSNDKNTLFSIDIPDSLDKSLKNLTDQPTAYIGNFISDVFELIFGKFHHKMEIRRIEYQHKVDEFKKNIQQKIEAIPPEKLIEPDFQTVSQAVENAQYCLFSEELQEMFANLIANSINIDYGDKLHPSFSEIIKQMSPLDAKILKEFTPTESSAPRPIVDIVMKLKNQSSSSTTVFDDLYFSKDKSCPVAKASISISSLARLGLISISDTKWLTDDTIYDEFREFAKRLYEDSRFKIIYSDEAVFDIRKKCCQTTVLGLSFIDACVK